MNLRAMAADDYDAVYRLWLSCPGMGLNDLDDSREGIGRFLERNPSTCLVAEADGRVIGVILAGSDGRRGHIYHAAVHPEYRRQGIGRRLAEAALETLERLGIRKVCLVAFERNAAGNAFWERMGFAPREDLVYRDRALADMTRIDT